MPSSGPGYDGHPATRSFSTVSVKAFPKIISALFLFNFLSLSLSMYLSIYLSTCLFVYPFLAIPPTSFTHTNTSRGLPNTRVWITSFPSSYSLPHLPFWSPKDLSTSHINLDNPVLLRNNVQSTLIVTLRSSPVHPLRSLWIRKRFCICISVHFVPLRLITQ